MAQNPYIAGNPVGNTASFVGRADVLREVLRVLRNPNQNTLVLYGQRRIGKTSILQYLDSNLSNEGQYHPVYFDLQDKASHSLSRVLKELAGSISNALGIELPDLGRNAEKPFRQTWLPNVLSSLDEGHSLVVLFDEFDVLSNPKQDQAVTAFFPYLRSLLALAPDRLQFIFVIGRNIDDVGSIALSLFKGTPSYSVSLLSHDDATALIRLAEKQKILSWDKKAVAKILELTNGHPFLTQQICSQIFEDTYEKEPLSIPQINLADVENAIPKVLNMSGSSLEWIWDGLPPAGRVVASALAHAGSTPITQDKLLSIIKDSGVRVVIPELLDAPLLLQKWDLIQPADGGYVFRVELLRQWIVKHKHLKNQIKELDQLLPIAQGLYQAAIGSYQEGQLGNALDYLRKAITKNPNHLRANDLLAEILIAQNNFEEAQTVLERLIEYHPAVARPRLVDVLLSRASAAQDDNERLAFYDKALELEEDQREALSGKQRIWKRRADEALEVDDYAKAVEAYKRAGLADEAVGVEAIIRENELKAGLEQLSVLEEDEKYLEAMELVKSLAVKFPKDHKWSTDLKRLERNSRISELYQRALGAIQSKEMTTARDLLLKVVELNPEYENASRYLHLAITGVDVEEKSQKLRRSSLVAISLIILLMFVAMITWREFNTTNSLNSTVQTMRENARGTSAFLTAESRDITAISKVTQQAATLQANVSTAQASTSSTAQSRATSTAMAQRFISDSTINNLFEIRTWVFSEKVRAMDFSPNGEYLAAGLSNGELHLWNVLDLTTDKRNYPIQEDAINSLAFSPDGQFVALGLVDRTIRVLRVSDGSLFRKLGENGEHTTEITKVIYSPNGEYIASISADGARVWTTSTYESTQLDFSEVTRYSGIYIENIRDIDFSSDGKTLAVIMNWRFRESQTCYDYSSGSRSSYNCTRRGSIFIFNSPKWEFEPTQTFDKYQLCSIKFSPVTPLLFYSADNSRIYTLSLNDASNQEFAYGYACSSIGVNPTGTYLVSMGYGDMHFLRVSDKSEARLLPSRSFESVIFASTEMFMASYSSYKVTLYGIPYLP